LETKVNFIAKQNDVRPFLKSADLYVICSKHEGMPMALVEAMTMGVPVLGTNCMGVNFVLKDFPEYLIPSDDSVILAQKIMEMLQLSAQERAQIGAKLRAYCINHFSIQNFVSKHEMVYQNLVKNKMNTRDINKYKRLTSFYLRNRVSKKIVVIESDDWGLERAIDATSLSKIVEKYGKSNISRWTTDAIESVEDLELIYNLFATYQNSFLKAPQLTANFITHNIDYSSKII